MFDIDGLSLKAGQAARLKLSRGIFGIMAADFNEPSFTKGNHRPILKIKHALFKQ
ncbi:MAG: hypothetical protein Q7T96_11905 [Methylobacter sp.]|uniref:hypothetical protein n=1 Tax=Methylobacter sp. TaxID=2051955 RepID=UPI002728310C|nr:hypothetical protein [Methylobacter sp.]MDO9269798.1 hypothetical protein [Methylobacter sp.]MDP1667112.1 hypothetical protein [Methylobacter sp.]